MYNNGQMGAWGQNGGSMGMQGAPGSMGAGGGSFWPGEQHPAYQQSAVGFGGGQGYRGYSLGSSGNSMLDMIQNMNMSNSMASNVGARRSAQNSAPWATGAAGLQSLIQGQGNAAHNINQGAMGYLQQQQAQQWQEHMARLQSQLQMDQWKQMQPGWGQQLMGIAGTGLGAYLGGPGGAALGGKMFGGGGGGQGGGGWSSDPSNYEWMLGG